jgi:hypothetical protein
LWHSEVLTFISYQTFRFLHMTKDVVLAAKIAGCSPDIIRKLYVGTDRDMEEEAKKAPQVAESCNLNWGNLV